ncbi:hypothetical protein ALC56_10284 [Trachymyrmex septentrionalis]|uniref:Uncharacterized protein n=1 Tax=Trachymyrmex septentrionalis TaxID=34720 RepID=A0A195F5V1_9HYME|nr:hypothetical protein ALC56_10284 [Trachymyrmex septentrionalis]
MPKQSSKPTFLTLSNFQIASFLLRFILHLLNAASGVPREKRKAAAGNSARVARWETCLAASSGRAYHIGSGEISSGKSLSPTVHPSFGHSLVGPRSFCTGHIKAFVRQTFRVRPFPTACIMHAAAGCFDDADDDNDDVHTKEKDRALISGQRRVRTKKELRQNSL